MVDGRTKDAAYMAKLRAVTSLEASILASGGSPDQVRLVLADTLARPKIVPYSSSIGFNAEENLVARQLLRNAKETIEMAADTSSKNGRVSAERHAITKTASFLAVGKPTRSEEDGVVKYGASKMDVPATTMGRHLGLPERTARRVLKEAREKKGRILSGEEESWSMVKKNTSWSKVKPVLADSLQDWIENSPYVRESPNKDDYLLVRDDNNKVVRGADGKPKKVRKLILDICFRELHNTLIKPSEEGGLDGIWAADGRLIVSEWALRKFMPQHIKRASKRDKQMCCCEKCVIAAEIHEAYKRWRTRKLKRLKLLAETAAGAEEKASLSEAAQVYEDEIFDANGNHVHPGWKDVVRCIQCDNVGDLGHPHWKCALGRCSACPPFPVPAAEKECDDEIAYNDFIAVKKCTAHGILPRGLTECPLCSRLSQEELKKFKKTPTLKNKKCRVTERKPIKDFLSDVYIPKMEDMRYHMNLFIILGKNGSVMSRFGYAAAHLAAVTWHDYAERFSDGFDQEIMTERFGNDRSVSMEGFTIKFTPKDAGSERELFYGMLSDEQRQDSATTHHNMLMMIDNLLSRGDIDFDSMLTILDHTDGAACQYWSGTALLFNTLFAMQYGCCFDRHRCAPGHGKYKIDGIQGGDKQYLSESFSTQVLRPGEESDNSIRAKLSSAAIDGGKQVSFAKVVCESLSHPSRAFGAGGHKKDEKRREKRQIDERRYMIRDPEVAPKNIKMQAIGFLPGPRNGMKAHHNARADPALGTLRLAMRRIPCCCEGCSERLARPWVNDVNLHPSDQPRYHGDCTECKLWPMFEGLNNWRIVTLVPKTTNDANALKKAQATAIDGLGRRLATLVKVGGQGAYEVDDDPDYEYYPIQWVEDPYEVEEDGEITEGSETVSVRKGEWVCKAKYFDKLPNSRQWYTPSELTTIVRMSTVLAADITMAPASDTNPITGNLRAQDKQEAERSGAVRIADEDHGKIKMEALLRKELDYEIDVVPEDEDDEEDDGEDGEDEDDDDNNELILLSEDEDEDEDSAEDENAN